MILLSHPSCISISLSCGAVDMVVSMLGPVLLLDIPRNSPLLQGHGQQGSPVKQSPKGLFGAATYSFFKLELLCVSLSNRLVVLLVPWNQLRDLGFFKLCEPRNLGDIFAKTGSSVGRHAHIIATLSSISDQSRNRVKSAMKSGLAPFSIPKFVSTVTLPSQTTPHNVRYEVTRYMIIRAIPAPIAL